jgi:alkaline phosphatase
MGPHSLSLTRSFRQQRDGLAFNNTLVLDNYLIGQSRTRSSSSLVTDSAAGATAFSCGMKSYNGAISVLPDKSPCGTVLEAAKLAGYMTGLVVTTRITDATPACFSAHVNTRGEEDRIAEQQLGEYPLGRMVDLMLGGGRCHFLPNTTEGGCRKDARNLIEDAQNKYGFHYVGDRAGFDSLKKGKKVKLPLLGLLAETDIPYEIDRKDSEYPGLAEMAKTALTALELATKDSEKGFFLMIEGSRIDHAGHDNDPAAQVREVLGYDKAWTTVIDFLDESDVPGVLVGTSDHETGGLAIARQLNESYPEYLWKPEVLEAAKHSAQYLSDKLKHFQSTSEDKTRRYIEKDLLLDGLSVDDATDEEIKRLMDHQGDSTWVFSDIISRRALIGWSTHGHSGADVNIYASDPYLTELLAGNHENTEVGHYLAKYLDVDVNAVTKTLRKKGVKKVKRDGSVVTSWPWMGRSVEESIKVHGDHSDCYHHETSHGHANLKRDGHGHFH